MLGKLTTPTHTHNLGLITIKLTTFLSVLGTYGKQCATSGLTPIGLVNSILLLLRADCK